jgi:hypothetical protein
MQAPADPAETTIAGVSRVLLNCQLRELLTALAWPRDPALEAAALADEARMIAEQQALDDSERETAPAGQTNGTAKHADSILLRTS